MVINYRFPFSVVATTPGASVQIGDDPAYQYEYGLARYAKPYEIPADMVAELEGYEVIGPVDALGQRVPIKRVAPVVSGNDIGENISPNEHMCPTLRDGAPETNYPFRDNSQDPKAFGTKYACINLGKALLMGGGPDTTSVKLGPTDTLNFKVEFPTLAHGGAAAIVNDMEIKAHIAYAKGADQMLAALKASLSAEITAGANAGTPVIPQGTTVGDLEIADVIGAQSVMREVPATIDDWSSLNGGQNADDPQIKRIMIYTKNNQATTPNQEMELTRDGQFVQVPHQAMRWTATDKKFYRFTHVGVIPHANMFQIKFDRGNTKWPMVFNCQPQDNPFVMPQQRLIWDIRHGGPTELPRPYTLMKEIGSVKVTDNGVSIPAWAAGVRGFEIAMWGYEYTLR